MTGEELEWLDRYHAAVLRELGAYLNKEEGAWLEKGVRAGGTMNVCIAVLLCFALLGRWMKEAEAGWGWRKRFVRAFRPWVRCAFLWQAFTA